MPRGMMTKDRSVRKRKPRSERIGKKGKAGPKLAGYEQPKADPVTGLAVTPLIDKLEDMLLWGAKTHELQAVAFNPPYSVKQQTYFNCIRDIKDGWAAELAKTLASRVAKNRKRLERIVERAFKSDDLGNARAAIMDQSKLTGDLAPDVHVMLGGDKSPEDLMKAADDMRRLALEETPDE